MRALLFVVGVCIAAGAECQTELEMLVTQGLAGVALAWAALSIPERTDNR